MYQSSTSNPFMSITGIQGHLLEVTAVGCYKLKDTEWVSRQDPYVCLEYASTKFSTRTCTDGGKNPTFQEKFTFSLIEGLRELNAVVWNSNTLTYDDFIGSAKIQLHKVLSEGYDDCSWPLQTKTGRHAGEVRLILHYANANAKKPATSYAPSAPPYVAPYAPQVSMYSTPPPAACGAPYTPPTNAFAALFPYGLYPTSSAAYPPNPYPPQPAAYPSPYPQPSAYPPPPPPHASSYYPSGPFPGIYPPPTY
ncbi:elicitor-responsive protein 1-like [Actinidia eriantha]|uniref:elicitor-responsive protein 1-like n=1 Tax=Actinidia eriantha TaxID=165200 RepID=UPI00258FBBD8|nr:elicitor-responsive protein 1-like [Actinidia eriantha]